MIMTGILVVAGTAQPLPGGVQVNPVAVAGSNTVNDATYAEVKAAFTAINAGTHTGTIVVTITGLAVHSGTAFLNASGVGAASYTSVKLVAGINNATIQGTTTSGRGVLELNGADNVTIDGDNPASPGVDRNLTIENTSAVTNDNTSVVRLAMNTTVVTGCSNIKIKNCILNGSAVGKNTAASVSATGSENRSFGILASARAHPSNAALAPLNISDPLQLIGLGAVADSLVIQNNAINQCARGIAIMGADSSNFPNLVIDHNLIGAATAGQSSTVYARGMVISGFKDAKITSNYLQNIESFLPATITGISLGEVATAGVRATVENNVINGVRSNHTATYSACGINLQLGTAAACTVRNNFIFALSHNASGSAGYSLSNGVLGIQITDGSGYTVVHNSVHLTGTLTGTGPSFSAAVAVGNTSSTATIIGNNILSNSLTGGSASSVHACIYLPYTTASFGLIINGNAYFSGTGTEHALAKAGLGGLNKTYKAVDFVAVTTAGSANFRNMTSLLGSTSNDNSSLAYTTAPPFWANDELHLNTGSTPTELESGGVAGWATYDIDNDLRPGPAGSLNGGATAPDIGADEFDGVPLDRMTLQNAVAVQLTGNVCPGTTAVQVLRIELTTTGDYAPLALGTITLSGSGTTQVSDVVDYQMFYTGQSAVFDVFSPVAAAATGYAASNFVVTPASSIFLPEGTSYLWLVCSVADPVTGTAVDATFEKISLSGVEYTPSVKNPAGSVSLINLAADAGAPVSLCPGSSGGATATVSGGSGNYAFSWDHGLGTSASITFTPAASVNYAVTVTDNTLGCSTSDTLRVFVRPLPPGITPSAADAEHWADASCYDSNTGYTHYFSLFYNEMLLSVRHGAWTPGTLVDGSVTFISEGTYGVKVNTGSSVTANLSAAGAGYASQIFPNAIPWIVMNRTWDVMLYENAQEPPAPVEVRVYFTEAEVDSINARLIAASALPLSGTGELTFYKLVNATPPSGNLYYDAWSALADHHTSITVSHMLPYHQSFDSAAIRWSDSVYSAGVHYAQLQVPAFSGGGGGGGAGGNVILPSLWNGFDAEVMDGNHVLLNWELDPHQIRHFEVERSKNGISYQNISGEMPAVEGLTTYEYLDLQPSQGRNFYRIVAVNEEGKRIFTQVIEVYVGEVIAWKAYPNPFTDHLLVELPARSTGCDIEVMDMAGHLLFSQRMEGPVTDLDLGQFAGGMYLLRAVQEGENLFITRIQKR